MIAQLLMALIKANVAVGVAILPVLAIRSLLRPRFGAQATYLMWLAPLAAGLALLAPHPAAPSVTTPIVQDATAALSEFVAAAPTTLSAGLDVSSVVFGVWIVGVIVAVALLLRRQTAFLATMGVLEAFPDDIFRARTSDVGPAVVGVLRPRIVTPADFETRFEVGERELILAHERVHLRRGDATINAIACLLQCLCWFNPLIHLAARLLRIDQELACDAVVIDRFPAQRRIYAELLLKTQLASQILPLGCHWPAGAEHPLKARIAMLKSPLPARSTRRLGFAAAFFACASAAGLVWASQPTPATQISAPPSTQVIPNNGNLEPAQARQFWRPGLSILCKPDENRELHHCQIKGSAFDRLVTDADVAREWPAQAKAAGLSGWVMLQCTTNRTERRLDQCSGYHFGGAAQRPELKEAFEQAAVRVISVLRLKALPSSNDVTLPAKGFWTIDFSDHPRLPDGPPADPPTTRFPDFLPGPPVNAAAATSRSPVTKIPVRYASESYTPPPSFAEPRTNGELAPAPFHSIWIKKPNGDDMVRLYPVEAVARRLAGDILMSCKVGADGRLNSCTIGRVDISGAGPASGGDPGFAAATLELAKLFQMEPTNLQGAPTAGTEIRIPVRFTLPHPAQPVAPS